jgi:hypothetical protein
LAALPGTVRQMCSGMIGMSASVTVPSSGQADAQVSRILSGPSGTADAMVGTSLTWCVQRPVIAWVLK